MAPALQEDLTYEDVMNVYREEQKRAGLTEVRKDFYRSLRWLIEQLTRTFEKETAADPYSVKTRTLRKQLENLKEMAPRIFEYRAGKVVQMAVRAMGGGKVDLSRLTDEEKAMLDGVLQKTNECRHSIFGSQDRREVIAAAPAPPVPTNPPSKPAIAEELMPQAPAPNVRPPESKGVEAQAAANQERIEEATLAPSKEEVAEVKKPQDKIVLLRILEDLPSFAGPDGTYRLRKEDVVTLPETIGRTLIKKGKAEEIRPGVF
jgi:DNA replication initiation complex subunit (GINS family)